MELAEEALPQYKRGPAPSEVVHKYVHVPKQREVECGAYANYTAYLLTAWGPANDASGWEEWLYPGRLLQIASINTIPEAKGGVTLSPYRDWLTGTVEMLSDFVSIIVHIVYPWSVIFLNLYLGVGMTPLHNH